MLTAPHNKGQKSMEPNSFSIPFVLGFSGLHETAVFHRLCQPRHSAAITVQTAPCTDVGPLHCCCFTPLLFSRKNMCAFFRSRIVFLVIFRLIIPKGFHIVLSRTRSIISVLDGSFQNNFI